MMVSSPPAILLITCDQLRKDALSCYGGQAVSTPHLDRLAATGTRFERAYTTSPWCMPSRSALLTGQLPHNHGAYSNFRQRWIAPSVPNLYNTLSQSGYEISHVGKCHYAPVPYDQARPDQTHDYEDFRQYYRSLGIDHLELQDDKQVSVWFRDDYAAELDQAGLLTAYRDAIWSNEHVFAFPGPAEWHPDAWVGRKARERVLSSSAANAQFVWVSFSGPHFPFDSPEEYLGRVDMTKVADVDEGSDELADPDRIHHRSMYGPSPTEIESGVNARYSTEYWRELRHRYYANVALIDDQVGQILTAAQQRFGDDVLVVFTADHGEMLGHHGIWGKGDCFYEDVWNVPLLLREPGRTRARVERDAMVMTMDISPTILQAAGLEPGHVDGRDLLGARTGHDLVVAEGEGFLSLSDGDSKLVRILRDGQEFLEFFDLTNDPDERTNVAARPEYAERLGVLRQRGLDLFIRHALP